MIIFLGNSHSLGLYEDFIDAHRDCPDVVVSCQYPHLVPKSLLQHYTCVNIHYGKLPEYAGCRPVYWQILEGSMAGVTLHYMDENFDSGDIIDQTTIPIGKSTADQIYEELALRGKFLLEKHFQGILDGTAPKTKQDTTKRRYYPKTMVDFDKAKRTSLDPKEIQAVHFEGKQYPIVNIGGVEYEVRRCQSGV